jgi:hypothetical protein
MPYLTLAKAAKTVLVSADAKLVRKVADTRLVIGLKEYATPRVISLGTEKLS